MSEYLGGQGADEQWPLSVPERDLAEFAPRPNCYSGVSLLVHGKGRGDGIGACRKLVALYPDESPESITYWVAGLMGDRKNEWLSAEDFLSLDPQMQEIVADCLLGETPTVMLPHTKNREAIRIDRVLSDATGRTDRGVALVRRGDEIFLVEGRVGWLRNFRTKNGPNIVKRLRWPADFGASLREMAVWLSGLFDQEGFHDCVRRVVVDPIHIEEGLKVLLSIPQKGWTREEYEAQRDLLDILNKTSVDFPLNGMAYHASRFTKGQLEPNALVDIDIHAVVKELREGAKMSWADVICCIPAEMSDVRLALMRHVVEVADIYCAEVGAKYADVVEAMRLEAQQVQDELGARRAQRDLDGKAFARAIGRETRTHNRILRIAERAHKRMLAADVEDARAIAEAKVQFRRLQSDYFQWALQVCGEGAEAALSDMCGLLAYANLDPEGRLLANEVLAEIIKALTSGEDTLMLTDGQVRVLHDVVDGEIVAKWEEVN